MPGGPLSWTSKAMKRAVGTLSLWEPPELASPRWTRRAPPAAWLWTSVQPHPLPHLSGLLKIGDRLVDPSFRRDAEVKATLEYSVAPEPSNAPWLWGSFRIRVR